MGRKIDFYAQICILIAIASFVLAGIFKDGYIFVGLFLLLPLGLWQMNSAAVHTYNATHAAKKIMGNYWKACVVSLLVFTAAFFVRDNQKDTLAMIFAFTGMGAGVITAFYYLYIYKKYLLYQKSEEAGNAIDNVS